VAMQGAADFVTYRSFGLQAASGLRAHD
jgi:hypothetical protein